MNHNSDTDNLSNVCESDDSAEGTFKFTDWFNYDKLDSDDEELLQNSHDKVFCFETDHAALKGNADYHILIKTMAILQAQRYKAVDDIKKLERLRCKVRKNPSEYLKKFLSGDTSDIPSAIKVQQVPNIDWSKYSRQSASGDATPSTSKHTTSSVTQASPVGQESSNIVSCEKKNEFTVRGRAFDQSKPQTFNQLWTPEEQMRLEELLIEFPPERNENSRWRKIANALGNRTTTQVCSRVQKYFKKLNKAGLPIPGHQLKTNNMTSMKKKPRRAKKRNMRESTFFPTQHLGAPQLLDGCEEDEIKTTTGVLTEELKADLVNRVNEVKKEDAELPAFSHPGIKCAVCAQEPLKATRWHCLVCPNVSLCSDCVLSQLDAVIAVHPPSHPVEPLMNPAVTHWDPDYTPDSFQSTNYLDPNFVTSHLL